MSTEDITFRISRPYKVYNTLRVKKVVLPALNGDITILPDRAPTLLLLGNGLVQILDDKNNPVERYFIKGGVADIARNRCAVSTEKVVDYDKHDVINALRKRDEAIHQEDKDFYDMIINIKKA